MKAQRRPKISAAVWLAFILSLPFAGAATAAEGDAGRATVLLEDDFSSLPTGQLMAPVGPHTEYHFLPEAAPKGNWAVTTFVSSSQKAWEVRREKGATVMAQIYDNPAKHTHPMIGAGDELWSDYTVMVRFAADAPEKQCGLAFRYQNDRNYYFFGVQGDEALLKRVRDGVKSNVPDQQVLARAKYTTAGQELTARVRVRGAEIQADLGSIVLEAKDETYPSGKVALLSDGPARFRTVRVTATLAEGHEFEARKARREEELARLQAANPKPVVWKKNLHRRVRRRTQPPFRRPRRRRGHRRADRPDPAPRARRQLQRAELPDGDDVRREKALADR